MQRASVHSRLQVIAATVKPGLRVVALVYTGLGGMLAMMLVVSVALMPVAPVLQQAAEPARQAMSNLVQPTSDAVTSFLGGARAHVEPVGHLAPTSLRSSGSFSDLVSLDVTIQDGVEDTPLVHASPAVVASAPVRPALPAQQVTPDSGEIEFELETDQVSARRPVEAVIVQPTPAAVLQIASQDTPKPLPPVPTPTETALQVKAHMDAQNQAAIDAAKASQARAKAEADAANNAAIAARKAAVTAATVTATTVTASAITAASPPAVATAESISAPTTNPNTVATPTATPQSKVTASAANQAAIDAAKLAQARARAQTDAANQTALTASRGAKPSAKTTPTPTAQPTSPPARPTAQPTPTNSLVVVSQAPVASVDVFAQHIDEAALEDAPMDQATAAADPAPA